jgi:putative transposase
VGHHLPGLKGARAVLVPVLDRGYLQPQGRGREVYAQESGERASELMQRTVLSERCAGKPLVLHSDNGAPMKSSTLLSKLFDLGVTPLRGRPWVSNDNPYSESLFRTLKYCPQWPKDGFADLDPARSWVRDFIRGYNHEHRHSRIRFATPAQRHRGEDPEVLARSHRLYQQARNQHTHRWSGATRNWQPPPVSLHSTQRGSNRH